MIASQVALLNDFMRPPNHSQVDHAGGYEAWWDTRSRKGDRPDGWSRDEILDALLLNDDSFYETQTSARGESAPDMWEEKATNQAHFPSSDNPFPDERDLWDENAVSHARFARERVTPSSWSPPPLTTDAWDDSPIPKTPSAQEVITPGRKKGLTGTAATRLTESRPWHLAAGNTSMGVPKRYRSKVGQPRSQLRMGPLRPDNPRC